MAYQVVSKARAEALREGLRAHQDKWKISGHDATKIAQEIFGKKGFAGVEVQHTLDDPVDPDGWVIPLGKVWGYTVGYTRKGKRGSTLHTKWTSEDSYRDALRKLLADYKRKNAKLTSRVEEVMYVWGIL
jgi:Arc/MetJ-type ribon-helix-helix transcriptional regulator